jgi:hypothetical protein
MIVVADWFVSRFGSALSRSFCDILLLLCECHKSKVAVGLTATPRRPCGVVSSGISMAAGELVPSPLPSNDATDQILLVGIIEEVLNGLVVV